MCTMGYYYDNRMLAMSWRGKISYRMLAIGVILGLSHVGDVYTKGSDALETVNYAGLVKQVLAVDLRVKY